MDRGGELITIAFFKRSTLEVARDLLGKYLFSKKNGVTCGGMIVETEAYLSDNDMASHSARKKTNRNEVMFGPSGMIYVYLIYGIHYCFNLVCGREGVGTAVLVRALEPVKGVQYMKRRREKQEITELASGPAKLTQALGIDNKDNGKFINKNEIFLLDGEKKSHNIGRSSRIGISKSKELDYRYFIKCNRHVS